MVNNFLTAAKCADLFAHNSQVILSRSLITLSPDDWFSTLQQHPQRDQSSQAEAEPASDELVCAGQEEDTSGQRYNEHEEPGEAGQTGQSACASPTPAPSRSRPSTRSVAGKLDLDLSTFEFGHNLLQRTWQC